MRKNCPIYTCALPDASGKAASVCPILHSPNRAISRSYKRNRAKYKIFGMGSILFRHSFLHSCDGIYIPSCIFTLISVLFRLFLQDSAFITSYTVNLHNLFCRLLCIFHELCVFSSLVAGAIISTSSRDRQPQLFISWFVPVQGYDILPFFSFLPKTHDGGCATVRPGCRVFFFFSEQKALNPPWVRSFFVLPFKRNDARRVGMVDVHRIRTDAAMAQQLEDDRHISAAAKNHHAAHQQPVQTTGKNGEHSRCDAQ